MRVSSSSFRLLPSSFALAVYWPLLLVATHWPRVEWIPQHQALHFDKLIHFAAYLVLAVLIGLSFTSRPRNIQRRIGSKGVLALLAVVSAVALLDEWTQPWTGREFDWHDWLADTAGAACGLLLTAARRGRERGERGERGDTKRNGTCL